MFTFAYGSNLDPTQMHLRCPQAQFVGTAKLEGYRLCFPRWSKIRASAVVGVEPASDETVWGVLYDLREGDLARLDLREGYHKDRPPGDNQRYRETVTVTLADGRTVQAEVYMATPSADRRLPSDEYIAYLLQLAEEWDLPLDYRDMLRAVKTQPLAA
jgi:gamma-glutamylcyclotransferase (GGCT)/AIG2-like uncharacterized protein YtfP